MAAGATKLQAVQRGRVTRAAVRRRQVLERRVTALQARQRGNAARCALRRAAAAPTPLRSIATVEAAAVRAAAEWVAATRLQAALRGLASRWRFQQQRAAGREVMLTSGLVRLQALVRGRTARSRHKRRPRPPSGIRTYAAVRAPSTRLRGSLEQSPDPELQAQKSAYEQLFDELSADERESKQEQEQEQDDDEGGNTGDDAAAATAATASLWSGKGSHGWKQKLGLKLPCAELSHYLFGPPCLVLCPPCRRRLIACAFFPAVPSCFGSGWRASS